MMHPTKPRIVEIIEFAKGIGKKGWAKLIVVR